MWIAASRVRVKPGDAERGVEIVLTAGSSIRSSEPPPARNFRPSADRNRLRMDSARPSHAGRLEIRPGARTGTKADCAALGSPDVLPLGGGAAERANGPRRARPLKLTDADLAAIEADAPKGAAKGKRYPSQAMARFDSEKKE